MAELNIVDTGPGGAEGQIQTPYLQTLVPGYSFGTGNGYLEFGSGTPGSLPFRVDQGGNVTANSINGLAGLLPSGDTTGAADPANIQALLNLSGSQPKLAPGTFYIGGSAPLAPPGGTWFQGSGTNSTILKIVSAFTGAQVITQPLAGYSRISDMSIVGASSTTTSNPACNGIEGGTGRFNRVDNVFFQYINGWAGEDVANANAGYASMWTNISGLNCAGGIHIKGVSGSGWGAQQFLDNVNFQQIGVGTGPNANLDVFRFEDCFDLLVGNINTSVSDASTGSSLNIMGKCSSLYFSNPDIGAFPNATTMTNAVITFQDTANGSPSNIVVVGGIVQQGLNAVLASGGASNIWFIGTRFFNCYGSGVKLTGTGADWHFLGASYSANGQGGAANSGTYYDLEVTGSSTGIATDCIYTTPVVAVGVNGVQNAIALPNAGFNFPHSGCKYEGSGTPATPFTHVPGVYTRYDGNPPSWNGILSVTSGQASAAGFSAINTASSPTVPFSRFQAKNAAELTAGIFVSGDTVARLQWDSNGKMSWGAGGSAAVDTNLYRAAAGVLKTDSVLTPAGGTNGASSAPVLTPTFANGTAAQLADITRDYTVYLQCSTAGTALTVSIGPTSTPANTLISSSTATLGELITIRLPAGWFLKWAATTAAFATQTAVGC
jgi:hypothetical protein